MYQPLPETNILAVDGISTKRGCCLHDMIRIFRFNSTHYLTLPRHPITEAIRSTLCAETSRVADSVECLFKFFRVAKVPENCLNRSAQRMLSSSLTVTSTVDFASATCSDYAAMSSHQKSACKLC